MERSLLSHVGGTITILGNVTFDPILRTLTCVSTGGVATSVTWTRDSTIITEGNLTVLDDVVTAQYTYTLSVTTQGEYICTVSNNKPSTASATILLGIYNSMTPFLMTLFPVFRSFKSDSNSEWSQKYHSDLDPSIPTSWCHWL